MFDTELSPAEEKAFITWKAKYAPKDSGADYDLRGAFKAGLKPNAKTGHWPDTFKKPNHPTFSDESIYAIQVPWLAGHWDGDKYIPPNRSQKMGIGNETTAGSGMGGGVGYTPSSDFGSSGMASIGSVTGGDIPGVSDSGVNSIGSGPGWMDKLGKLLQDPQVMAAMGQSMSKFGSLMSSIKKLPPHAQDMLKQAMGGGQHKQVAPQDDMNPYGGDMMKFITPDMARGVLDGMGIPYGRMR